MRYTRRVDAAEHASTPTELDWVSVWTGTASRLAGHWALGRAHLLTEDVFRMCLVDALEERGVAAPRLAAEVFADGLGKGKLDLTIDGPTGTVIELKYPRDSRTGMSPDTMTLGELLRDFCRVAAVDSTDRWVAQVVNARLARYLASAGARFGFEWAVRPGQEFVLTREVLETLPPTALTAMGEGRWRLPVSATCRAQVAIVEGLDLVAYQVAAPPAGVQAAQLAQPQRSAARPGAAPVVVRVRGTSGARAEILMAVDEVTAATGRGTVTIAEVLAHMKAAGTRYADSTIRTMMSSHLCADSQGSGIDTYEDLERLGRGEYRRKML